MSDQCFGKKPQHARKMSGLEMLLQMGRRSALQRRLYICGECCQLRKFLVNQIGVTLEILDRHTGRNVAVQKKRDILAMRNEPNPITTQEMVERDCDCIEETFEPLIMGQAGSFDQGAYNGTPRIIRLRQCSHHHGAPTVRQVLFRTLPPDGPQHLAKLIGCAFQCCEVRMRVKRTGDFLQNPDIFQRRIPLGCFREPVRQRRSDPHIFSRNVFRMVSGNLT